ncbi:MAG: flagellar motor protein MotB [Acidobacteriota bacterium]
MSESAKPPIIVKKINRAHGHHGGAWKVAYADFVTAMMALFLVLWLVSQGSKQTKQAIGQYFRDPGVFDSAKSGLLPGDRGITESSKPDEASGDGNAMAALQEMAKSLQETFNSLQKFEAIRNQIQIAVTKDGLEIQLVEKANRVFFDVGSAHPKDYTRDVLIEVAKEIGQQGNRVTISGHTDRRPYSNDASYSNWELSTDRANCARRLMVSSGLNPEQVASVSGYADTRLLDPKNPYADANRRITILVMPTRAGSAGRVQLDPAQETTTKTATIPEASRQSWLAEISGKDKTYKK